EVAQRCDAPRRVTVEARGTAGRGRVAARRPVSDSVTRKSPTHQLTNSPTAMSETLTPRSRAFWAGWISAGLFLLVAAGAGVYAANLRNQYDDVTLRLVDAVTKLQLSQQQLT